MDLLKATPLELGMTGNLDRYHIGPIPVEGAMDGEELKDEVREITDEESLELLEGIGMGEVSQQEVNDLKVVTRELSDRMQNVESRIFDYNGDKGHISRTEERIDDLKKDISTGFSGVYKGISDLDGTFKYAIEQLSKKMEDRDREFRAMFEKRDQADEKRDKVVDDIIRRLEAVEKVHKDEADNKKTNRHLVKSVAISVIAKWIGGAGALVLTALGSIKAYLMVIASKGGN